MTHTVSNSAETQVASAQLLELIAALETRVELRHITEHLHSARTYLLGSMPREYAASLDDARKAASEVLEPGLRQGLDYALALLQQEAGQGEAMAEHHHHPTEKPHGKIPQDARSPLWDFFSTADVSFGVFYPKNHAVATFPSFELAAGAASELSKSGFGPREVIAIRSEEMLVFLSELKKHLGIWGRAMSEISRFFGTEEIFVTQDITEAVHGAGFLAVYCPSRVEFEVVKKKLEPFTPVAIQH